ncbi:MAG TPA: glutamine-hydrolyzing GMP synthase [Firmicutes bacterium]|nr:glutamine-hydrolyzing GMP synthase [Bacillota bacterium]
MTGKEEEKIIILDFGGQYSQLLARRVREARVFCEVLPYDAPVEELKGENLRGIILSGSPATAFSGEVLPCSPAVFTLGVPVLGIGYGMQILAHQLGGRVAWSKSLASGRTQLRVIQAQDLLAGVNDGETVWMDHGVAIESLPAGFDLIACTWDVPVAAMADLEGKFYGVQYHPEVRETPGGMEVIKNFLYRICGCQGLWTTAAFVEDQTETIKAQVGEGKVLCALSGGVDSSVAAALVHRAVGDQLTCVFVNHGLLRKGEAEEVRHTFAAKLGVNLVYVDARERFLGRLAGVTDPERKRKIIGEEFIRVFEEEAGKLGHLDYLVQGTIYPDVIESGTAPGTRLVKSHHNVGGLPEDMNLKLLEPLRELFKDEVRRVGSELGLDEELLWRHPFPGPGLAVRIIGEVTEEKLAILREADAIVVEEIKRAGLYREVWQAFALLPDLRSVGVRGDGRTYAHTVAIRAVTSIDAMTADWARLPHEVLASISDRIVKEVEGVNRVVYDITAKPPATIEWE